MIPSPCFFPCRKSLNYDYDVYLYQIKVIPDVALVNNNVWSIEVPNYYIINRVRICTIDGKIYLVYLDAPHPNSDLISFKYCSPESVIGKKLDSTVLYLLIENIKHYNLDNCYFEPRDIKYLNIIGKGGINARVLRS